MEGWIDGGGKGPVNKSQPMSFLLSIAHVRSFRQNGVDGKTVWQAKQRKSRLRVGVHAGMIDLQLIVAEK